MIKNKMNIDILVLEWDSKWRDVDILEPVIFELENKYNLNVRRGSLHFYAFNLLTFKPKILLLPSSIWWVANHNSLKMAKNIWCKVVSLTSEWDFWETKESVNQFFWWWNKDKILYEDRTFMWSTRVKKLIKKYIKWIDQNKVFVWGATWFDRYKYFDFESKESFLKKRKKKFSKVIWIAWWWFDLYSWEYFEKHKEIIINKLWQENVDIFLKSCTKLRDIYNRLVINNPDILFIMKYHPWVVDKNLTEFWLIKDYDNVIFINNEMNISDVISVSDLWVGFETTTCLEAWLLWKSTLLVNPINLKFSRSRISEGSPIYRNYEELNYVVKQFFDIWIINDFEKLKAKRKLITEKIIWFDDWLNHKRTAKGIFELFQDKKSKNDKIEVKFNIIKRLIIEICQFFIYKLLFFIPIKLWYVWKLKINSMKYNKKERSIYIKRYKKSYYK